MTVFMSRRHAYQAKLRHHFSGRYCNLNPDDVELTTGQGVHTHLVLAMARGHGASC
jgi:hypothetical protein